MVDIYQELGEISRRQILSELRSGSKTVSELVSATGMKQPNVSNHLARLRSRGIVIAEKHGRNVAYRIANPELASALANAFSTLNRNPATVEIKSSVVEFAKHACQGEELPCFAILDALLQQQVPLADLYTQLLTPAMTLVGTWYKVQAIDEAQEHLASAITERAMARALQFCAPSQASLPKVVLGCAPGNLHALGLRMVSDYLRFSGWNTRYLGADVPIKAFLSTVSLQKPVLVLTSCSSESSIEATIELIRALDEQRSSSARFEIGVGGDEAALNPEPFLQAGADFAATDLLDFDRQMAERFSNGKPIKRGRDSSASG